MQYNEFYLDLFKKICDENNYKFLSLSENYIFCIESQDNKKIFIIGNSLNLNDNVAQKICMDKTALSVILKNNGIPCVENLLIKNPKKFKNYDSKTIKNFLYKNKTIVIKDNEGSSGKFVYKTKSLLKTKILINKIHRHNKDVCLSKFENIEGEYRIIMLDGKCEIMYKKEKPFVIGDGKTSFCKLFKKKYKNLNLNVNFFKKIYIPRKNKKVYVSWLNNLSQNNYPTSINENSTKKELLKLAKKCVQLLNINFCSVDIIKCKDNFKVLEINSIVSTKYYASFGNQNMQEVKKLYLKAIKKSFEGEKNENNIY